MFSRALCIHKAGLANGVVVRLLGATYAQRSNSTLPANTTTAATDVVKSVNILDPVAVADCKKRLEALLKAEMPKPYDGPERDHVNFPRRPRAIEQGTVRLGFIPDEWFTFFYKKTGVTGPYLFGIGMVTFLFSKEWYVIDHEFSTGLAMYCLIYLAIKKFGAVGRKYGQDLVTKDENDINARKKNIMDELEKNIADQKRYVWQSEGQKILMEAKRENIQIQLETEYRRRMMTMYEQVKKRLDYQLDYLNTKRKLEQKHMVDWIVNSVVKSITPQQEKEALQKCLDDLKIMSAQAH